MVEPKKERPRVRATPWKTALPDQILGSLGEPPAYVKRALRVERAVEALMARAGRRYKALERFVDLRKKELDAAPPRKRGRYEKRLDETVQRCNARWKKWLEADGRFDHVNAEIDGFNRYYVQERQAALKYLPLWAAHVEDKPPFGPEDVLAVYCWMST
ncbi:MAG: hypothetical protein ACYTHK_16365 [Planctomycetota bacterium]